MKMRYCLSLSGAMRVLVFTATFGLAGAQSAFADPTAPASAAAGPVIDGFRTVKFGMTESQARTAIGKEFKISESNVTETENQLQRTAVLTVQLPDLVPGGGTAAASFVFGYQSHKLIEVNVLWSKQIDPKITPAMLYQSGESLQQYFAGDGFPAGRSTGNIATPDGVLLFRATDATGNAVLLILSGTTSKDPKSGNAVLNPAALTLAYAADPLHPDVFQLAKGSF